MRGVEFGPVSEDGMSVTLDEVRAALNEMDGGKAAGPDGLNPRMLKRLPESMSRVCFGGRLRNVGSHKAGGRGDYSPAESWEACV